ncbi:hypothetical protein SCHPADRAFT_901592 [Schizopora paradoxa]|uniref:DNA replication checkpoint mediator MRC1 domain-containing protein n=1 Tax=Schizopora paradoxa TaxID=27342 RepID=A0A0H2RWD2_9AGAM|nr:hypothetical protein SCHPADRAFT_901592 [Schizopora paradoxa]
MDDPTSISREPSPRVVKVKRTYGRKKDASTISDETAPSTTIARDSSSTLEKIGDATSDHEATRDSSSSPAPVENFGWKEKLKNLDKLFADDDDDSAKSPVKNLVKDAPTSSTPANEDDSFTTANSSLFDAPPFQPSSQTTPDSSPMPQQSKRKAKPTSILTSDDDDALSSLSSPKATGSSSRIRRKTSESPNSGQENETIPVVKLTRASESPVTEKDELQEPGPSKQRKKRGSETTEKVSKIKKPTKKDELESRKAHARMMAEQKATVRKVTQTLDLDNFLGKLRKDEGTLHAKSQPLQRQPSSDPIQQFSSPARKSLIAPLPKAKPLHSQPSFPKALEDSDEELLDVKDILQHDKAQKSEVETKEQRRKSLAMAKQKLLQQNARKLANANQSDCESDDDLEFVEDESNKKVKQKGLESKVRELHGMRPGRKSMPVEIGETQVLKAAAQPHFSGRPTKDSARVDHRHLLTMMRNKGMKQSERITKGKEEEWVERGGHLKQKTVAPVQGNVLAALVERLKKPNEGKMDGDLGEGTDEGSDEDWDPENEGSGSEAPLSGEEKENAPVEQAEDVQMHNDPENDDEENVNPNQKVGRRPLHRQSGRAVISDEEDGSPSLRPTKILVPDTSMVLDSPNILEQHRARRASISSFDDASFDENDNKENDMSLMFDQGEDKENLAVPRLHSPGSRALSNSQNRNVFDLADGMRQRLSMSPLSAGPSSASKRVRNPLQPRSFADDMDEEFPPLSATVVGSDSPVRPNHSSASSSPKPLQPAFGEGLGGFTQLFNDEDGANDENMPPPKSVLKPAFSFSSISSGGSQPQPLQFGGPLSLSTAPSQKRTFGGLKPFGDDTNELSLTLDTKLQPALEVNTQIRRKADAIFEKEQIFVLEEAVKKPEEKDVLYVTENGLLTQTRPDVSTPVVYRNVNATPNALAAPGSAGTLPPSTQRLPLSTLSFSSDLMSPTQPSRLSRLRKGSRPPGSPTQDNNKSGSPSRDAFSLMLEAQAKQQKRKEEAKKMKKSVFVEGEAQESDEDEEFGFGKKKGSKSDEEDSDDEDENAVIENLVDDTKKEDTREDLVFEKVQEQREHDDQELEKYHMNAIEGKFRGKRRGGRVGLNSDSESDDDDDEARRIRKRMNKKRRVAGDTLVALGKDEKSEAFVRGYEEDLEDDAMNDFAHLAEDEMEVDENDENQEPVETVDASEIQAQLRLAAKSKKGKGKERFDPENVDWAEQADWSDGDEKHVKDIEMPRKSAKGPRQQVPGQDAEMTLFTKQGEWDNQQLENWRKEQSNRNFGTGSARGAVTGTGHGKKNTAASSSKTSRIGPAVSKGQEVEKRSIAKAASALAIVSSKQSRFESE